MFLSTFEKQLDAKRRIVVPADFRALVSGPFDGVFCFPSITADCLEGGGQGLFKQYQDLIGELPFGDPLRDALETSVYGGMCKLGFDTAGRITLPDEICQQLGLTDWVTVVGLGDRFQVWDQGAFHAHRTAQRVAAREGLADLRLQQRVKLAGGGGMTDAPHAPVLLDEVLEALAPKAGDTIVDMTFGAGGYTRAILARGAKVIAFDRDPSAVRFAQAVSADHADHFTLIPRRFSELEAGLADASEMGPDGIVFDLGVSSMQLDEAERGFSFMRDGPLDMRMGAEGPTAADLVNSQDEDEIARLIWLHGEERKSRRIAAAIVRRRAERPFKRTLDLAEVVERALGGRRGAPTHPATRTFQALRIAVNEELAELEAGLAAAERALPEGGRLVVVTFHSLEDRIVKRFMTERAGRTPAASRHLPPRIDGAPPTFTLLFNGAHGPGGTEIAVNPRARSAKLRAGVRTAAPAWKVAA